MKDEKEWLVSDKTCKGCMYYGWFNASSKTRACLITCYTGIIRKEKPKDCKHKKYGKPPEYVDELRKHRISPKQQKDGAKPW